MKHRRIFTLAIAFLFLRTAKAQNFAVGDTSCNYYVVNHVFTTACGGPSYSPSQTYTIDIDGDWSQDIGIGTTCFTDPYSTEKTITLTGPTCSFAYGAVPCSRPLIDNLAPGTLLTPTMSWSSPTSLYYIYDLYISFSSGPHSTPSYVCGVQSDPFYVGFQKPYSNDTIYGWIKMDSNIPGRVISYAFKHTNALKNNSVFTNTLTPVCAGSTVTLTANPPGGFFGGSNVTGNIFSSASAGTFQVSYATSCTNTTTMNIIVSASPSPVFTNTETIICTGDSIVLTANPSGGVFSGANVSGSTLKPLMSGTTTAIYSYTNSSCSATVNKTFSVSACTGIDEIADMKDHLIVFPNPNNGEFEIKSGKEETVMISNELGQALQTYQLNPENNFSVKVSGLSGGVYFVGNSLHRKKIVVIGQ